MNKTVQKTIACCLSAVLVAGGTVTAWAVTNSKSEKNAEEPKEAVTAAAEPTAENNEKDETVYVLTDADGSVSKIIVSDWLKNALGQEQLSDMSQLTHIENVKGDETFTGGDGDTTLWDAQGNDIYYQGTIEKELPIGLTVSYTLDGKAVTAREIAGQSGKVTVRFDYENRQLETVQIDGRQEQIYVPFAALTGLLLDNDKFRNVTVTNGTLINDGDRTVVVGAAFPGLQEDLAIDQEKLNIPDYVEFTADAEDFSLGMSFTVATNEVFSGTDVTRLSSVSRLTEQLSGLTDAFAQLTDGMEQLLGGTQELAEGSQALSDGIGQLSDGLNTLTANNSALNGGAKQVFQTLLDTANQQIKASGTELPTLTISNYAAVLNDALGMANADAVTAAARQKVETAVRAQVSTVRSAVTAAVQAEVEAKVTEAVRRSVLEQVLAAKSLTTESYAALPQAQKAQIDAAVSQQMATEQIKATITAKTEEQMRADTVTALISSKTEEQIQTLIGQNMASEDVQAQIQAGVCEAAAGAESLRQLKQQLDSYNRFYQGLLSYTEGVSSAAQGASRLTAAMPDFVAGVQQLQQGVEQMLEGLSSADLGELDVSGLSARLEAAAQAAEHYRSFSGIDSSMDGQVRFIYRTDGISE